MQSDHPVLIACRTLDDSLRHLVSQKSPDALEKVREQLQYLSDLLERDSVIRDVSDAVSQVSSLQNSLVELLGDAGSVLNVEHPVAEMRSALKQIQHKLEEGGSLRESRSELEERILRELLELAKRIQWWQEATESLKKNMKQALDKCSSLQGLPDTSSDLACLLDTDTELLGPALDLIQRNRSLSSSEAQQLLAPVEQLESQHPMGPLRACLHSIKNALILERQATEGIEQAIRAISESSTALTESIQAREGSPLQTQLIQVTDSLKDLTAQPVDSNVVPKLKELLTNYAELIERAKQLPPPKVEFDQETRKVQHILVVEDEPGFQNFIRTMIQEALPDVRVYQVRTYHDAMLFLAANIENAGKNNTVRDFRKQHANQWEQLLQQYPDWPINQAGRIPGTSCLCVLDLLIPHGPGSNHVERWDKPLGLDLLELMHDRNLNLRVMILTSARDLPGVACYALKHGCRFDHYLYKQTCNDESFKQRLKELTMIPVEGPLIEVFSYTGSLIRIDGIEIELEHMPFIVFQRLASSPDRNLRRKLIIRDLSPGNPAYPNLFAEGETYEKKAGKLNDHIDSIRKAIHEAFYVSGEHIDTKTLIEGLELPVGGDKEDNWAYRLQAHRDKVKIYESPEEAEFAHQDPRVLVVEDQQEWHQPIYEAIREWGWGSYPIEFARTDEQALEKARSLRPNIAVLDMEIPRQDGRCHWDVGVELLEQLREELPDLRVVVFTAHEARDALREKVNALGVDIHDYRSKQGEAALTELAISVCHQLRVLIQGSKVISDRKPFHKLDLNLSQKPPSLDIDARFCVPLSLGHATLLSVFVDVPPLQSIAREKILEKVWPNATRNKDDALTLRVAQLRTRITEATNDGVQGKEIILGHKGGYRVHGRCSIAE